jgi:hypothetical protein
LSRTEKLDELYASDPTLANLYLKAIVEEVPTTMLGEMLHPDMLDKLRSLEWFREYEAEVKADAKAEADAEADARVAAAEARVAAAEAKAKVATVADKLTEFLTLRGDAPTEHALHKIDACRSTVILSAWLRRAYLGETSAQIFPETEPGTR